MKLQVMTAKEAADTDIATQLAWIAINATGWNEHENSVKAIRRAASVFVALGGHIADDAILEKACDKLIHNYFSS